MDPVFVDSDVLPEIIFWGCMHVMSGPINAILQQSELALETQKNANDKCGSMFFVSIVK